MRKQTVELTEAEWTIIKTVWEHEPCAAPTIQEKLHRQTEWTYSTVRTLMDRMVAKGLLTAEKIRNLTLDRKSTRLNSSHSQISYAVFCLKKKKKKEKTHL